MEKSNKIVQVNEVVTELNSILKDLDTVIERVHSVVRLAIKQQRDNQTHIAVMQDDFEILLTELKKYKNGENQNN